MNINFNTLRMSSLPSIKTAPRAQVSYMGKNENKTCDNKEACHVHHFVSCPTTRFSYKYYDDSRNSTFEFPNEYREKYPGVPIKDLIESVIKDDECYINRGSKNIVFSIPQIDNYVIRMPIEVYENFDKHEFKKLKHVRDEYPEENFGQPVMENAQKIQICKKQKGTPISADNWTFYRMNTKEIKPEQALEYLDDMKSLAEFPLISFVNFAKTMKKIDKHKVDYINPNNILIDKKSNIISRIDVTDVKSNKPTACTKENFTYSLIDASMNRFFYDKLEDFDKVKLDRAVQTIIRKANTAATLADLPAAGEFLDDYWCDLITGEYGKSKYETLMNNVNNTIEYYKLNIHPDFFPPTSRLSVG